MITKINVLFVGGVSLVLAVRMFAYPFVSRAHSTSTSI